mmetsp:Transcript_37621/g.89864  ORF Transcript_37621/g.89864 Transcript_37621/m.89864 type:complete len:229 (+) Transcript_37621:900-1586(+)
MMRAKRTTRIVRTMVRNELSAKTYATTTSTAEKKTTLVSKIFQPASKEVKKLPRKASIRMQSSIKKAEKKEICKTVKIAGSSLLSCWAEYSTSAPTATELAMIMKAKNRSNQGFSMHRRKMLWARFGLLSFRKSLDSPPLPRFRRFSNCTSSLWSHRDLRGADSCWVELPPRQKLPFLENLELILTGSTLSFSKSSSASPTLLLILGLLEMRVSGQPYSSALHTLGVA